MKLKYLLAILLTLAFSTEAFADILSEDFANCPAGEVPEGWSTWGTSKTPSGYASDFFERGDGFKVMPLKEGGKPYAVSFSSSVEGGKVSSGLVSPLIKLPEHGAVLSFTAVNYNPEGTSANKMAVYVSTTGNGENDFTTQLFTKRVTANNLSSPATYTLSLTEYAGKEIYLAFVNEGTNAGMLGIGDIVVADYIAQLSDITPLLFSKGEKIDIDVALAIFAPCNGFTATLTTDSGFKSVLSTDIELISSPLVAQLRFNNPPAPEDGGLVNYEINVMPKMDGVEPTVIYGSTGCGEGFPAVLVEEEATGENCGYCPAGSAGIEKFSDEFGDRFIGIGIHCTEQFSTGVMENHEYSDPYLSDPGFSIVSLPSAVFNRRTLMNPTMFDDIQRTAEAWMEKESAAKVTVNRVDCDMTSGECVVDFSAEMALPYSSAEISAAAVVIADNLTGYGPKWYQSDYFSGTTKEQFLKEADESWWPYMSFYCEYPTIKISPTDMAFNHVGMGIYPDYYGDGCIVGEDWSDGKRKRASISFAMPMQEETNGFGVQHIEDTSVALLLFNHRNGEIISGQKVMAADYNKDLSGVGITRDGRGAVAVKCIGGNMISVTTAEKASVKVYSIGGTLIISQTVGEGTTTLPLPASGIYMIETTTSSSHSTHKIASH